MRLGLSNLESEKNILKTVEAKFSIPVPQVYDYYSSAKFEHLILQRQLGITLENAWRTLNLDEKTIADQVVSLLGEEIRDLHSRNIEAALYRRKPLRAEVCGIVELDCNEYLAPAVEYAIATEHPWWLEDRHT